jgi:hypothetical protein
LRIHEVFGKQVAKAHDRAESFYRAENAERKKADQSVLRKHRLSVIQKRAMWKKA